MSGLEERLNTVLGPKNIDRFGKKFPGAGTDQVFPAKIFSAPEEVEQDPPRLPGAEPGIEPGRLYRNLALRMEQRVPNRQ